MASDFETVIAKCDGCKYEEECREMPPCIMDAYNKGKTEAIDECLDLFQTLSVSYIYNADIWELYNKIKGLKEQNNG